MESIIIGHLDDGKAVLHEFAQLQPFKTLTATY